MLKKKLDGVQRRKNSYKDRMHQLENMSGEEMLDVATTSLNKTAADFIKSQLSLSRVKTKGRRYTLDSKGFVDFGFERRPSIENHALVFMARGVCKKWKQPLCYTFCKNTIKTVMLVKMIKNIILECQVAGLEVMTTVSDQGATNIGAINYLIKGKKYT
ncbi:hypothetical protein CBL_08359 [Carabus blaptoides fortunei]